MSGPLSDRRDHARRRRRRTSTETGPHAIRLAHLPPDLDAGVSAPCTDATAALAHHRSGVGDRTGTGAALLSTGRYELALAGALLVNVAKVMDAVDGEVARAKHLDSPAGYVADGLCDRLRDTAVITGLGVGAAQDGSDAALAWTLAAAIGYLLFSLCECGYAIPLAGDAAEGDLRREARVSDLAGGAPGGGRHARDGRADCGGVGRPLWLVGAIAVLAPFAIAAKVRRLFAQRPWEGEDAEGEHRVSATRAFAERTFAKGRVSPHRPGGGPPCTDRVRGSRSPRPRRIAQFGTNLVRSVGDAGGDLHPELPAPLPSLHPTRAAGTRSEPDWIGARGHGRSSFPGSGRPGTRRPMRSSAIPRTWWCCSGGARCSVLACASSPGGRIAREREWRSCATTIVRMSASRLGVR